jgi:hypothetical protein
MLKRPPHISNEWLLTIFIRNFSLMKKRGKNCFNFWCVSKGIDLIIIFNVFKYKRSIIFCSKYQQIPNVEISNMENNNLQRILINDL